MQFVTQPADPCSFLSYAATIPRTELHCSNCVSGKSCVIPGLNFEIMEVGAVSLYSFIMHLPIFYYTVTGLHQSKLYLRLFAFISFAVEMQMN